MYVTRQPIHVTKPKTNSKSAVLPKEYLNSECGKMQMREHVLNSLDLLG